MTVDEQLDALGGVAGGRRVRRGVGNADVVGRGLRHKRRKGVVFNVFRSADWAELMAALVGRR